MSKSAANNQPMIKIQEKFQRALALHQKGQLAQAEDLYEQILKLQPKHFDALHLIGVIAAQTKNFQRAVELIDRAIEINPNVAEAYSNRGNALHGLKQHEAALQNYDKAIALKPDNAEIHNSRGNVLDSLKRHEAAIQSYDKAITLKPDYAEAYYNRGNVLRVFKRHEAAIQSYDKAITLKPDYAKAYYNRGNALRFIKQNEAAIRSYDKAIAFKPGYAASYNNRGNALKDLKRYEAALQSYDKAIAFKPDYVEAYNNRGHVLEELRQHEAALQSYDKAIALKPDYVEAYNNRGNALKKLKQHEAALQSYDKAIAFKPDYVEAYNNRGSALQEIGQHEIALQSYGKAIMFKPDYAEAHWNLSLCLLQLGSYKKGWEEYEWRWKSEHLMLHQRSFVQPLWLGQEPLQGKTILLHNEQGLGDALQFCRYVKMVADLGARVILEVQKPLLNLFATLDGITQLVARGEVLPTFDCHCSLLSLPLAFKTDIQSIPVSDRYVTSNPDKISEWQKKLGIKTKPRVGLVWSGNTKHANDHNRSISLLELGRLLPLEFQYVSLQKELRDRDNEAFDLHPDILHFGDELNDFGDTAALCEHMDLIISVDTSVAHLAGAMGKPVWILLPFNSDWRWLLDRIDSPWYPKAKLYRQDRIGGWDRLFERVKVDLTQMLRTGLHH